MPTTPYAQALVSVNGGGAVAGAVSGIAVGASLQLSPASTVGWQSCRWELYAVPPGFAAPSGWTQDDAYGSLTGFPNAYYYAASGGSYTPPAFPLNVWGKVLWRLRINGALNGDPTPQLTDITGGASAPSTNGLVDVADEEQGQFGGWDEQYRVSLRAIDTKLSAGGGASNAGRLSVPVTGSTVSIAGTPNYVKLTGTPGVDFTVTLSTPTNDATCFTTTVFNATPNNATLATGIVLAAGQSGDFNVDTAGVGFTNTAGVFQ